MRISNNGIKYITKTIGALALGAATIDVCATGVRNAEDCRENGEADDAIRNEIRASRMEFASPMYSKMKEKTALMYPHKLRNCYHAVKGFISSASEQVINHAALIGSSIFALCTKRRTAQIVSGALLTCVSLYNIIRYGTNLTEKGDDLE